MAISRKSDGSLGLNDILIEIGANKGDTIDFVSLASALGIPTSNITLPDSFIGKSLSLTAPSATVSPSTLSFVSSGEEKPIQVTANGLYRLSNLPNWIVTDKTFANTTSTFNIRATNNSLLGTETRTGSISVLGNNNNVIGTINLSQVGNPATFTISPTTLSITTAATASTITLTLSNILEVVGTTLSNTTGFSLRETVTKTVGTTTTAHKYTLDTEQNTAGARNCTVSFQVAGGGFVNTLSTAVTQAGFVETLSIATSTLSFVQGGETKSFAVASNTDWVSSITGTGYEQSLSQTTGFVTTDLSGTGNDTIYIKASANSVTSVRTGTVSVAVTDGSPSDSVSLSQAAFVETLSIALTSLSFSGLGETKYFDVVSNTDWTSDITGTGYEQSLSSTSGFVTTDLSGTGNDRIYVKIARNDGSVTKTGSVAVAVLDGTPSDSISLSQSVLPLWGNSDITITGFDVDEFGDISIPTVTTTGGIAYTITYTTGYNSGTAYTAAAGFPLVEVDTNRYVNVTVTVPSTYRNPGSFTRTITAVQEERFYGSDEISISGFSVDVDGVVTEPTVSATGVAVSNITVSYDGGASVLTKGYPILGSPATRTVTATVTIPAGWYNSGTQSNTATDIQEAAPLTGWIYYPYSSTSETREIGALSLPDVTTTYIYDNPATTATFQFSVRTNFTTPFIVTEFGSGVLYEYGGLNSVSNVTFDSQVDGISPYQRHFEVRVPIPGPGGSNVSTVNLRPTGFSGYDTEFDIVVNRGSTPTVSPTVDTTVSPTVRPKPQI